MKKDVLISVCGMQFEEDIDGEDIEVIQKGTYYQKNGAHYLLYDEPVEDSKEVIKNVIKFKNNEMQVSKKGPVNVMMNFREKEKNLTNYQTPFGGILIGIDTQKIQFEEKEDSLFLQAEYALDVNYQFLADCKITIKATSLPIQTQ